MFKCKYYHFIIFCFILVYSIKLCSIEVQAKDEIIVVSMGDSYSSGEGIEDFYGYNQDVDDRIMDHDWLAHRSENSWPGMLVVNGLEKSLKNYKDKNWYFVATSGAETKHFTQKFKKEYEQEIVVDVGGQKVKTTVSGFEYIAPQLEIFDRIEKGSVDYVTLTIGGNDAGFEDIVKSCALGSTYLHINSVEDKLNDVWFGFYNGADSIQKNLRATYLAIAEKAGPQAHIIVAGYPCLFEERVGAYHSKREAELVNQAVSDFNKEIEKIVVEDLQKKEKVNIAFVSVETKFAPHQAGAVEPFINRIYPMPKKQDLDCNKPISAYSLHPNLDGAQVYADCVQEEIKSYEEKMGVHKETTKEIKKTEKPEAIRIEVHWDGPAINGSSMGIEATLNNLEDFEDYDHQVSEVGESESLTLILEDMDNDYNFSACVSNEPDFPGYILDSNIYAEVYVGDTETPVTYSLKEDYSDVWRSYTGVKFWGPFGISKGKLVDYDPSWMNITWEAEKTEKPEESGGYSDEELINLSAEYYYSHYDEYPPIVEIDHEEADIVILHLYGRFEGDIGTESWYEINRYTCQGQDDFGNYINLLE